MTTIKSRNLPAGWHKAFYTLWLGCFITGMGYSMTMPFISLFISDLGNYSKNDKEIFEKVTKDNRLESAIKNCKEIYEEFNCDSSNASKNPCTKVFMLVEDLSEYLK